MPVRRAVLIVSTDLLCQMLRDGTGMVEVVANPLPADARIVDARVDFFRPGNVMLHVESASFAEVREGELYPELPSPVFRRTGPGASYLDALRDLSGPERAKLLTNQRPPAPGSVFLPRDDVTGMPREPEPARSHRREFL